MALWRTRPPCRAAGRGEREPAATSESRGYTTSGTSGRQQESSINCVCGCVWAYTLKHRSTPLWCLPHLSDDLIRALNEDLHRPPVVVGHAIQKPLTETKTKWDAGNDIIDVHRSYCFRWKLFGCCEYESPRRQPGCCWTVWSAVRSTAAWWAGDTDIVRSKFIRQLVHTFVALTLYSVWSQINSRHKQQSCENAGSEVR